MNWKIVFSFKLTMLQDLLLWYLTWKAYDITAFYCSKKFEVKVINKKTQLRDEGRGESNSKQILPKFIVLLLELTCFFVL